MEILNAEELEDTLIKAKCECGVWMSTLPPDSKWRTVKCKCGAIWWVKPSGRVFERHKEPVDFDY